MTIKEYDEYKPVQRALGLKADGMPGPKTLAAVALRLRCHETRPVSLGKSRNRRKTHSNHIRR